MKKLLLPLAILFSSFEIYSSSYVTCEMSEDSKDWKKKKNILTTAFYIATEDEELLAGKKISKGTYVYNWSTGDFYSVKRKILLDKIPTNDAENKNWNFNVITSEEYIDRKTLDYYKAFRKIGGWYFQITGKCVIESPEVFWKKIKAYEDSATGKNKI